jgi:transposase
LARTAGRGTFVPLTFAPGEAFQFDWSEDWAVVAGERVKFQVAQFKLSYSRAFFLRAYPLQTHEMLFDAHVHAFAVLGGVPRRGIYDNMKTAVDRVRVGKARDVNARFAAMVSHTCSRPSSAASPPAGRRGRSRRTCRIPGTGCGTTHRRLPVSWHSMPGCKNGA